MEVFIFCTLRLKTAMHASQLDFGGYSPLNQPNGKTSQNVKIGPSMRPVGVTETPKKKEKRNRQTAWLFAEITHVVGSSFAKSG